MLAPLAEKAPPVRRTGATGYSSLLPPAPVLNRLQRDAECLGSLRYAVEVAPRYGDRPTPLVPPLPGIFQASDDRAGSDAERPGSLLDGWISNTADANWNWPHNARSPTAIGREYPTKHSLTSSQKET